MSVDYDTTFRCTYRDTPEAQQDDAYRSDVLRAFKIAHWDGAVVGSALDRLFEKLQRVPGIRAVLSRIRVKYPAAAMMGDDDRTMFQLLFSFDLFDKAHASICDLLEKGEIEDGSLERLSENM